MPDVTPEGFLYDMGGHVIFSHYDYFDQLIDTAVGTGTDFWNTLERVSYVRMKGVWVPYPFQNNITALPVEDQIKCISGLVDAKVTNATAKDKPANFDEWILRVMGPGIADIFMRPYNFKVWAILRTRYSALGWVTCGYGQCRGSERSVEEEDAGWGRNAVAIQKDGTGGIWKAVAKRLPQEKQKFNVMVTEFKTDEKKLILSNGDIVEYNSLISTIPLDILLNKVGETEMASRLTYSSTHVIGLGLRGKSPHDTKCWLYYPEDNCPFYRCTVFSHYAEANSPSADKKLPTLRRGDKSLGKADDSTPSAGPYWSLMFEVSESAKYKPVDSATIVEETIQGAINTGMSRAPTRSCLSTTADSARLSHAQPGERCRARRGAASAQEEGYLEQGPLRLLQVRGGQSGPQLHDRRGGCRQHSLRLQGVHPPIPQPHQ